MQKIIAMSLVALTLALGACGSTSDHPAAAVRTSHYAVTLDTLNGSGVTGTIALQLTGNVLAVTIDATGLALGHAHYQHIHGYPGVSATCPTTADANASGIVTIAQAMTTIGQIALDLYPYPMPGDHGAIHWSHSYTLTEDGLAAITPLAEHVIVFHGMSYHGVYDAAMPVACGAIRQA